MFKLNLKIALRNLWKNKVFSLINIGGLAIGMACCLMLMVYVNHEFNYDKQFENIDNIYVTRLNMMFNGKLATTIATPAKLAPAMQEEIAAIQNASRVTLGEGRQLYSRAEHKFKLRTSNVDSTFFKILKYPVLMGSIEGSLRDPNTVVITKTTADKLFGKENPIGQAIKWDDKKDLKVVAVLKELPQNQTIQFDVLQPWTFLEQIQPDVKEYGWGSIDFMTVVKLKNPAQLEATNAILKPFIVKRNADLKAYVYEPFLTPLSKMHLYNEFENGKEVGGRIDQVRLFLFLAICVLAVACINYMNLSTARSEKRAREVGVRKALGSARSSLVSQFILESLTLSTFAMFIAFALLELALPNFNQLLGIEINVDYKSPLSWAVFFGMILITGLLAGSYPSFYLSSFIPVKVLKGFRGSSGALSIRKLLVVLQFGLSVCMIISAVCVYNQIQFLKNKPLGFDKNYLVEVDLEGKLRDKERLQLFKTKLFQQGTISSATEFAGGFTENGTITGDFSWPGKSINDKSILNYRATGYDFVKTTGVKLLSGRDFSTQFSTDTSSSILLNEAAVKLMGLKNPIGQIISWNDTQLKVIGIIKDYFNESQGLFVKPTVFYYNIHDSQKIILKINPNQSISNAIAEIKRTAVQLNPAYPLQLDMITDSMEEKLQNERLLSVLSNLFGGFAIFISCLGLLGLALYMAEQRSKEISVRKVLGADISDILVLLNKDFFKLVITANLIAMPVAYILMSKWLQQYDYKITMGIWPFVLAILSSVLIAVITVSLQTFKVAKANPVDALKYE